VEKQKVTIAFGRKAFSQLCEAFEEGRWMSWDYPDLVFRLELDQTIQDDKVVHVHDGRRNETQKIMEYNFPYSYLPDDITRLLNMSYGEAIRCFEVACFLASIALCGRTIETALGALYEKTTGVHPSNEPTKPGMNAIINLLKKKGFRFPPGLKEKMELIAVHRNVAVHGNLEIPTDDEARSVIYTTRDVLKVIAK
jgi:hypothetical protein